MPIDRGIAQYLGGMKKARLLEPKPATYPNYKKAPMRKYVCAAKGCGLNFDHYVGVKTVGGRGSGLGLCQQHNPEFQKSIKENKSGNSAPVPPAAE